MRCLPAPWRPSGRSSLPGRRRAPRRCIPGGARRPWWKTVVLLMGAFILGGLVLPNLHVSWREPFSRAQERGGGLGVTPAPPPQNLAPEEGYARAAQIAGPAVVNIDMRLRVRV